VTDHGVESARAALIAARERQAAAAAEMNDAVQKMIACEQAVTEASQNAAWAWLEYHAARSAEISAEWDADLPVLLTEADGAPQWDWNGGPRSFYQQAGDHIVEFHQTLLGTRAGMMREHASAHQSGHPAGRRLLHRHPARIVKIVTDKD
jgi:hypothetical protein